MVFVGGEGDWGENTRVEASPDMRKAVWTTVAGAQPFKRIAFSGYWRVEFYTVPDAAKPAAVLFVNVTDASHLEGQDEDMFRCAGLTELTSPLLQAEYKRHHPHATQPATQPGISTGRVFYLMGEIPRPGTYTMTGRKINIKTALAAAGYQPGKKKGMSAVLIRRLPDGTEKLMTLDIEAILAGKRPDVFLQADDVVVVRHRKAGNAATQPATKPAERKMLHHLP